MINKICSLIQKEIDEYITKNEIKQTEFAILAKIPPKSFANIMCRLRKNKLPSNRNLIKIDEVLKKEISKI